MKIVQVDINGTRGLALTDTCGSRVTVAPIAHRTHQVVALHRRTRTRGIRLPL